MGHPAGHLVAGAANRALIGAQGVSVVSTLKGSAMGYFKAVALLAEAGFGPDNPLSLTLNYNTSETHKKIAIGVSQFWK